MTRHVSYAEFRKNLAKYLDKARKAPLRVEREDGSVVVMSQDEFEGLMETLYLLSNPANARDLAEGIAEAEAGKFVERGLIR